MHYCEKVPTFVNQNLILHGCCIRVSVWVKHGGGSILLFWVTLCSLTSTGVFQEIFQGIHIDLYSNEQGFKIKKLWFNGLSSGAGSRLHLPHVWFGVVTLVTESLGTHIVRCSCECSGEVTWPHQQARHAKITCRDHTKSYYITYHMLTRTAERCGVLDWSGGYSSSDNTSTASTAPARYNTLAFL